MEKKYLLVIFALVLIAFCLFSTKVSFHDSYEYITISKNLAGVKNMDIFSAHSILYPLIISLFLKFSQSFLMIKLVNILWVFLIGVVLLSWLKNKTAFIIFAFSPLIWFMGIQTTPILPASFFFLLAYIFFRKEEIKYNWVYSGFFLGLCFAFYTPMILVAGIFMLVYFWNKKFSYLFKYLIAFFLGFLPRLVLDYFIFKNPIYSLIRYGGDNLIISLGLHSSSKALQIFSWEMFLFIIVISPLLFRIYKIDFKKYHREIIFLSLTSLIFILRKSGSIKYFLIITPIVVLLLSKVLSKKEIKWHCILSVVLIVFMTFGFFGQTSDVLIQRDLEKIVQEFEVDYIVAGPYEAPKLSTFLWQDRPEIVWFMDYESSLDDEIKMRGYCFDTNSKITLRENLEICANFNRPEEINYESYIIVSEKKQEINEMFKLNKCYETLCVYENA